MRDNREKWRFYKHPSKPALKSEEVRYWKNALTKLLKVGIELEFNLPEKKGSCKGDNAHCPCIHIDEGCWKECANISVCKINACVDTCKNKKPSCFANMCETCKEYEFMCLGTNCIEFVSACFSCNKFDRDCEKCNKKYNLDKDPEHIRNKLIKELNPSGSYGNVGKTGVVSITQDGSLQGDKGVEIITVGRRPDYYEFYQMIKRILVMCEENGAYLNERCSSHMHLLTSYYDNGAGIFNELEKDMPEIIAANFHQLCRRYQNAITWMTMALADPTHMTRWEKFRISVLDVTPVSKSMSEVKNIICEKSQHASNKEKYGWTNYSNMRFKDNKISRFHVEMRVADSTMCPSFYAGIACLFHSLVIKAAEISRYGILKVGEDGWLKEANSLKKAILNGTGGYDGDRVSNTTHVLDYKEQYVEQSIELINQLKGILMKLGPAYDVLIKLANQPVALRRIAGDKWEDIENSLAVGMAESDQIEFRMNEIIDLRHIEDCKSIEEWIEEVSKVANDIEEDEFAVEITKKEVKQFINNKMREGELIWSDTTGSIIAI